MSSLRQRWRFSLDRWLRDRLPRSRETVLNQRRIFILPTRQGGVLLLVALAIFLGGINYSNSLMLATSFLLCSLFMVSILHTWANLSGLVIRAGRAEPAFSGEEAAFHLRFVSQSDREHEAIRLAWGRAIPVYVDLSPGQEVLAALMLPSRRRGRYRPGRLRIETSYPLGLLCAWSWVDPDMESLIYPKPIPCEYPQRESMGAREGELLKGVGSDDFEELRPYQIGDSPRHIAWRSVARTGDLVSKQFGAHSSRQHWLEWEAFAGQAVEERLGRLCYWVVKLHAAQEAYGLRLPGIEYPPGHDDSHRERCLAALALHGIDVP